MTPEEKAVKLIDAVGVATAIFVVDEIMKAEKKIQHLMTYTLQKEVNIIHHTQCILPIGRK